MGFRVPGRFINDSGTGKTYRVPGVFVNEATVITPTDFKPHWAVLTTHVQTSQGFS